MIHLKKTKKVKKKNIDKKALWESFDIEVNNKNADLACVFKKRRRKRKL